MTEAVEPQAHDLLIRGVRVRYLEAGQGPPLVLVHGFIVSAREWIRVIPLLATTFRVIAPDLPGFGESEKPASYRYDREGFADTLCDLMAGLDIARAHVAGHSFGAAVAATLAADHPERIERLALVNANTHPFELPFNARMLLAPVIGPILFKQVMNRFLFHDYFKKSVFPPGFAYDRAEIDRAYDNFNSADAREAAFRVLPYTTREFTSLLPKLGKIRAPTLIVWGELDPMFPVSQAQALARAIPETRLEVLPTVAHSPPEEAPERTAELLLQHFTRKGR